MCVFYINNPTYLTEQHLHKTDLKCFQAAENLKLNMPVVENSGSHVGFCIVFVSTQPNKIQISVIILGVKRKFLSSNDQFYI